MMGKKWPSEIRTFVDEQTGRKITRLTANGNNVHMYFTENSFTQGKNEIIFQSDRASDRDRAPHEDPDYSIFRMSLDTGEITQLSDDVVRSPHAVTKTPEGGLISYSAGNCVKVLNTETGKTTKLYEERGRYQFASVPSIAPNRQYVAFCRNEETDSPIHYHGANYSGFKERFYAIKDWRITLA